MKMKCLICNKEFEDAYEFLRHLFLSPDAPDVAHDEAIKQWRYGQSCPLCGGEVRTYSGVNEDSWETSCMKCHYLYDED